MQSVVIIIIIIALIYLHRSIQADCGPPGKSSGSEFSPVLSQRYPELYAVTYRCQESMRLFTIYGENKRVCRNGTWIGEVPKCAKIMETDENFKHYEILNHTKKVTQNSTKWSDSCSETYPSLCGNQTWIFDVLRHYEDVRYAEILFTGWPIANYNSENETIKFGFWTAEDKFLTTFKLIAFNQYNLSHSGQIETSLLFANPILINRNVEKQVSCDGPFSWKSPWLNYPDMNVTLSLIGDRFAGDVRFCAINLYSLPNSCGTPDIPLHAQIVLINHINTIECHRFVCDKNYKLVGHSDIECSSLIINDWIGETPLCVPNITCARDNVTKHSPLLEVRYQNTETFNGVEIAVIDSIETYSCSGGSSSSATLIGKSQRICLENGSWDEVLPKCMLLQTDSQSSISLVVIALSVILFCTLLALAIALVFYFNKRKRVKVNDHTIDYYDDNFDKFIDGEYYQEIDDNDNSAHNYDSVQYETNEYTAEPTKRESPHIYLAIN